MKRKIRATAILATLLVLSTAVAAPAAADSGEESVLESASETTEGALETAGALADAAAGAAKGYAARVAAYSPFDETEWSTEESATEVKSEISSNGTVYAAWLSERIDATEERDTLAVEISNRTDSSTVYVVADARNGSYENLTAKRSTSRTVDERCTLKDRAGRNASDELETFRERFVVPNEDLDPGYLGRMGAEYSGEIECSFTDS